MEIDFQSYGMSENNQYKPYFSDVRVFQCDGLTLENKQIQKER